MWRKDGRHIPTSTHRYRYANFHTELVIENVQPSDESTFTCYGNNDIDSTTQNIFLDVQGTLSRAHIRFTRWSLEVSHNDLSLDALDVDVCCFWSNTLKYTTIVCS